MSGEHHCAATSTVNKKCECEDDLRDSDRLWTDFEHCAQQVSLLYRDPTWKSLQTAAASTTQLYKSSIDVHRRGFEKGFRAGRISLAKEVMTALTSGSATDLNSLFEMLYANVRLSSTDDGQRLGPPPVVSSETLAAVHLFQQALSPAASASPQRGPDLNAFLSSQVQRHRKRQRQRSPTSPSTLIKKVRRI
ncbi:unnamed protein product [Nippostrongylus brasiliensis]|uniref:HUWE1-associated protein modifying stress responses n=1 Tax=Nippostrongylus brasiliensis TaxID=27835 RepID=A0A158QYG2_NIPBR|nr:hypothetical protein Q1695_008578 [Nippostrongylus brasiliensis]VDL72031.1 unnamed protein product [Nippostrongylus brasiliensis]